ARTEEAHRALVQIVLAGGGMREVTAEVAGLLRVAVAMVDTSGRILAAAGDAEQVAILREELAASRGARAGESRASARCTAVPVVAGGHHHGEIVACGAGALPDSLTDGSGAAGSLTPSDIGILERAATVAALVISRQEAVTAVESKYRADFLRDVLTGRGGSRVAERARAFGWDLERRVVVLAAEIDSDAEDRPVQDR